MPERQPILTVRGLRKTFAAQGENSLLHRQRMTAVDGVSFDLYPGETFGLVGESGCGKSTVAKLLMGLEKPDSGEITLEGKRLDNLRERQLRPLRIKMQMVFQDSGASLNPRKRVGDILREPMLYHGIAKREDVDSRIEKLLSQVGLAPEMRERYPHEFSGGQRQRICIARALSLEPRILVLDEPVSALDVSVQAQILNLLQDLQEEKGLTYIFITHDLSVVKHISDDILVMYLGVVVEKCPADELFERPLHPYTKGLLSAIPIPSINVERHRILLQGELSSPVEPKPGCRFANRCPHASDQCRQAQPPLTEIAPDHFIACHHAAEIDSLEGART